MIKLLRREPGRDGKILSDHKQDGNDRGPSTMSEIIIIIVRVIYQYNSTTQQAALSNRAIYNFLDFISNHL